MTASAKFGASNVLAVRVNNQQPSSRWYSGSGIYRHVWLKTVNPVRVAYTGAVVTTPTGLVHERHRQHRRHGPERRDAAPNRSPWRAPFGDATGTEVGAASSPATSVAAGKTATVTQTVTVANPKLWSLASPTMYSVITTVSVGGAVVDTYTTPFGIRTFAFSANSGFTLNGAAVKLNGTCNHHDLGALGAAVNTRAIEKRLQHAQGHGGQRPSHVAQPAGAGAAGHRRSHRASWSWTRRSTAGTRPRTSTTTARFFNQWSTTDIGDMVARDRNHPSIIIWSIGNEIQDSNNATVAQSLIAAVKAKDTTRAIGQAFASGESRRRGGPHGRRRRPQLRAVRLRLASLEQPELEVLRQRVVVRRPEPRRLQDARRPRTS